MIATDLHRKTSFTKALIYGKLGSSSIDGLLPDPTTRSSSSHAFRSTSGKAQHARTKVTSVELEVSLPAPNKLPVNDAISSGRKLYCGASLKSFLT